MNLSPLSWRAAPLSAHEKTVLDKDPKNIVRRQRMTRESGLGVVKIGLGLVFLVAVWMFATVHAGALANSTVVIAAGVIGGYMALNIGANDVANNIGPAVGARALTMAGALVIAAVFGTSGALLAGGDVVSTIKQGIIDPGLMPDVGTFIWVMMAALLAAALWLNLATWIGAPVSTTHAIVGGVMGAGIAATGLGAVNWPTMGKIAASWVVSPLLGGLIAALFLGFIKLNILYKDDKLAAARRWVPVLVAIMASVFSMYLVMKGLKKVWEADAWAVLAIGAAVFAAVYLVLRPYVRRRAEGLENRRRSVYGLFTVPLICSAALLSFAHGANDVANAVAPLAAIVGASSSGGITATVGIPLWVMVVGAFGISAGLVLFGPKLVRTVGERITRLNPVRAFCVALAAAITVIIASAFGLPVSSTHIALGAVFGVGFLREFIANWQMAEPVAQPVGAAVTPGFGKPPGGDRRGGGIKTLVRKLRKAQKRRLVRRRHLATIVAAWLITVPAAALLAAALYFVLDRLAPS